MSLSNRSRLWRALLRYFSFTRSSHLTFHSGVPTTNNTGYQRICHLNHLGPAEERVSIVPVRGARERSWFTLRFGYVRGGTVTLAVRGAVADVVGCHDLRGVGAGGWDGME